MAPIRAAAPARNPRVRGRGRYGPFPCRIPPSQTRPRGSDLPWLPTDVGRPFAPTPCLSPPATPAGPCPRPWPPPPAGFWPTRFSGRCRNQPAHKSFRDEPPPQGWPAGSMGWLSRPANPHPWRPSVPSGHKPIHPPGPRTPLPPPPRLSGIRCSNEPDGAPRRPSPFPPNPRGCGVRLPRRRGSS